MFTYHKLICKRCGHTWIPRKINPTRCPKCNSIKWDQEKIIKTKKPKITYPKLTCKRCGYSWYPRGPKLPMFCAGCNSLYWNRERGQKIKKEIKPQTATMNPEDLDAYYKKEAEKRIRDEYI